MTTIALITGANRGLGYATARQLAQQGTHTLIGARDRAAGELTVKHLRAEGLDVECVALDVTDAGSVRAAADVVRARHGRLDILVNNAGILPEVAHQSPAEVVDLTMFERTFATNVIGAVAVLEAFLPLLRRSEAGRVVNVSSTMGSLTDQLDPTSPYYTTVLPAYQSSKAALNSITIALSKQLSATPIKVTSVCPGFVQTDLTPISRAQAPLTAEDAAGVVVAAANLDADVPSGTFIDRDGAVPW